MAEPIARLNLGRIEQTLRELQQRFADINAILQSRRDSLDDVIIERMMSGYAFVDDAVAERLDLFALGNSAHLLELNARVLCGTDPAVRAETAPHLQATRDHFYDDRQGGFRDVVDWYHLHREESVWQRAAGVYVRGLSRPQLFIEGNHRTGALIMSYLLAREGRPPFVLTVDNARAYFDPSTLVTRTNKGSFRMLYRMPKIKRYFAAFLKDHANLAYILEHAAAEG
ncbi:MAG: hypothetical protein HC829_05720 [Bacteroidales bacterium]|nr:hypothetical protein [Bacteroidales bacterium]